MMTRADQVRTALERRRAEKEKYSYACGMCPSCRRKENCPGGSDGTKCINYESPEPTREEWKEIYKKALRALDEKCSASEMNHRIGRVHALADALQRIHDFTAYEIREIENDMHPDAGRHDLFS